MMKDNGKITITVAEYKQLLQNQVYIDIIVNKLKADDYIGDSTLRSMFGIKKEEDK